MTSWCLIPTLVLYFLAALFYLALPFGSSLHLGEAKRFWLADLGFTLTLFGALLHLIYLGTLYFQHQFPPLSFVSFGVVALFLLLVRQARWQGLGSLFVPLAFLLLVFSLGVQVKTLLFTKLFGLVFFHVFLAGLALILMSGNFCLGLAFFIHDRSLKQKKWDLLSLNLPPLMLNEKQALFWLRIGFVLLTLVLLTGSMLTFEMSLTLPGEWLHATLAIVAWLAYALLLNRRNILLPSLLGFVSLAAAYLWN